MNMMYLIFGTVNLCEVNSETVLVECELDQHWHTVYLNMCSTVAGMHTFRQPVIQSISLIWNVFPFVHNTVIRRLSCYHIGSYE